MGKYINNNSKGQALGGSYEAKLRQLKEDGATVVDGKQFQPNLVCVVDSGGFGAAAYAYSEGEYNYFKSGFDSGSDRREHTWLVHPQAAELAN